MVFRALTDSRDDHGRYLLPTDPWEKLARQKIQTGLLSVLGSDEMKSEAPEEPGTAAEEEGQDTAVSSSDDENLSYFGSNVKIAEPSLLPALFGVAVG